jgi:hypothetical protein
MDSGDAITCDSCRETRAEMERQREYIKQLESLLFRENNLLRTPVKQQEMIFEQVYKCDHCDCLNTYGDCALIDQTYGICCNKCYESISVCNKDSATV